MTVPDTHGGSTRLVLLGTGTPNPDPARQGPSSAVVVGDRAYLVDAGAGIVRQAEAAARRHGLDALRAGNLAHLFLTHLHSDHTIGLPDVLLTGWVAGRRDPLQVIGPPGTTRMVDHVQAAWADDVGVRTAGLEPSNATGHRATASEVSPGVVYTDDRIEVTAFAVDHGSWDHAYGYTLRSDDRTIVFSGDTAPCDEVVRRATGCDVLVHECHATDRLATRPTAWQDYHRAFHTSAEQVGRIAAAARPGLVVLHHQLLWGATDDDLVAEVRRHHDGPVVSGTDLSVH